MTSSFAIIGVVIPYYQREAGILARALRSVARQRDVQDVRVVVVDDSSPAPAAQDIAEIQEGFPFPLEVIVQPNGGPGAARNRALEALAGQVRYVAFLDSDDEWLPTHLGNACNALERGYDFYFSDFYFSDYKEKSAFIRAGKIPLDEHRLIDSEHHFYQYCGNMFGQILV